MKKGSSSSDLICWWLLPRAANTNVVSQRGVTHPPPFPPPSFPPPLPPPPSFPPPLPPQFN